MTPIDMILAGGLAATWVGAIGYGFWNAKRVKRLDRELHLARGLISAETERKETHTKAFQVLSNPELIEDEMEKSALATEMRVARRTTLPRDDAGPPAKVYRPKISKRYPKSWPK